MLFVQQHSVFISIILSILLHFSYQQYALIGDNLKYYSQSHLSSNTIQTFWHDVNVDCELETLELIELYVKLVNQISIENEDQFDVLLRHHVRKRLIRVISQQLVEGFKTKSLKSNEDLMFNLDSIPEKRISKAIWRITINKVYPLVATQDIINEINGLNEKEMQALAYTNLVDKCMWDTKITETLMPILAYHISLLFKQHISCNSLQKNKDHVYCRLPAELRLLYHNSKINIYLLNTLNVELRLLYESTDQTIVLINQSQSSISTESLAADETNFRFYFTTNREGLVAFGKQYGDHINYLSAKDNITAFYYLGAGLKPNQLWHVIWPEYLYRWNVPGMIMLENRETGDLLCINRNNMEQSSESARNYYENNFILLNAKDNMLNPQCSWKFKKFNIL